MAVYIPPVKTIDERIVEITSLQYGYASTAQLVAAGLSHGQIARLVRIGRLRRVHRGVYMVTGVPVTDDGRRMAALLAGDDSTVLYGASALEIFGAIRRRSGIVETVTPNAPRPLRDVRTHRTRWLTADQVTRHRGFDTTTPSRAIVDYGYHTDAYELAGVLYELDFRRRLDIPTVMRLDERLASRSGSTDLPLALAHYRLGSQGAYSLEELFLLRSIREAGLPLPVANCPVTTPSRTYIVDGVWVERGRGYELDTRHGHGRPPAIAKDRDRDDGLAEIHFPLLRLDVDRMYADIDGTIAEIARFLGL